MTTVFALRLAGRSFDEIARELDYANRSSAWRAFRSKVREVRATRLKRIEDMLELENARLDALLEGHLPRARAGETESAFVVLGAIKERAKINGLYQPTQARISGGDGGPVTVSSTSPHEILLERINRLAQAYQEEAREREQGGASGEGSLP